METRVLSEDWLVFLGGKMDTGNQGLSHLKHEGPVLKFHKQPQRKNIDKEEEK